VEGFTWQGHDAAQPESVWSEEGKGSSMDFLQTVIVVGMAWGCSQAKGS